MTLRIDADQLAAEDGEGARFFTTGRRFVGLLRQDGSEPPVLGRYCRLPCAFVKVDGVWVLSGDVRWPRATQPWGRIVRVGIWFGMGIEDHDPVAVIPLDATIGRGMRVRFRRGDLAFDRRSLTDFARRLVSGTGVV